MFVYSSIVSLSYGKDRGEDVTYFTATLLSKKNGDQRNLGFKSKKEQENGKQYENSNGFEIREKTKREGGILVIIRKLGVAAIKWHMSKQKLNSYHFRKRKQLLLPLVKKIVAASSPKH